MDKGIRKSASPYDALSFVLKVLKVAGYFEIQTKNRCGKICHEMYRLLVILIVFVYNLQHFIYTLQVRNDPEFLEGVVFLLPNMALWFKTIVMYFASKKLAKLNDLLNDSVFAATNNRDEALIRKNSNTMNKLSKFALAGLSFVVVFWIAAPIFKRMKDETTVVPSYMPFEMNTWRRFLLANFLDTCTILWVGYGHFSIDCLIGIYYSQAQTQLKIIRYNLEHLFDPETVKGYEAKKGFEFIDVMDKSVHKRFVHFVNRYERVAWFTCEVNGAFGKAISFQFLMTAFSTCLVVYQMSSTDTLSVQFAFLVGFYLAMQFQLIMYCYFGGLVEYESKFVTDSLYLGEWLSLSPRFRRQLLIAMARWNIPIIPRVSGIVPLSLTTFIGITRSAYTLYAVLKSKNNRENGQRTLAF